MVPSGASANMQGELLDKLTSRKSRPQLAFADVIFGAEKRQPEIRLLTQVGREVEAGEILARERPTRLAIVIDRVEESRRPTIRL